MHIAFLNPQGNFDAADSHLTAHPDFGGQLVYVKQVALALAAAGHQVEVVTRLIDDPDWPEFSTHLDRYPEHGGVRIVRLRAGDDDRFLAKEKLWPFIARDWVPNILNFYRGMAHLPDAFTGHYGDGGLAAVLLEERTGVPFTFTAHSLGAQKMDDLGTAPGNLAGLDKRYHFGARLAAERLSMSRSAANITSTHQERHEQYAHEAYAGAVDVADDRRFEVIPPGVNLATFDVQAGPQDSELTATLDKALTRDLAPGRQSLPAVVASSRLDSKKNHAGLVRAFGASRALQDAANLVLLTGAVPDPLQDDAGAGPDERAVLDEVRQLVSSHRLQGKVAGAAVAGQAALAAAYRHFATRRSVFALTARYEPFGLAPLEAAACGLPVVVTQNGGPTETLVEGGTEFGVLVDPDDPADVARGLERVLIGGEWEHFAAAGRRRVLARYTWDRTAAGYAALLEEVVADPNGRRGGPLPIDPYFLDPATPPPALPEHYRSAGR